MMICDRCKKETHCIIFTREGDKICGGCYDKDERPKDKKRENDYFYGEKDRYIY